MFYPYSVHVRPSAPYVFLHPSMLSSLSSSPFISPLLILFITSPPVLPFFHLLPEPFYCVHIHHQPSPLSGSPYIIFQIFSFSPISLSCTLSSPHIKVALTRFICREQKHLKLWIPQQQVLWQTLTLIFWSGRVSNSDKLIYCFNLHTITTILSFYSPHIPARFSWHVLRLSIYSCTIRFNHIFVSVCN